MKETSGLELDAVLGSEPYLKGIRTRKTVETITKSEDVTKEGKRRSVADMQDLYERYYLREKPGRFEHKEEQPEKIADSTLNAFRDYNLPENVKQHLGRIVDSELGVDTGNDT